jgi:hypothetical protein
LEIPEEGDVLAGVSSLSKDKPPYWFLVLVRASPVGFGTGMHELQYAFSLAGLTGARPLPEFYYLIYFTSGFVAE